MKNQLYHHLVKIIPSFEEEIHKVIPYFKQIHFPKDHIVVDEGDSVEQFYFVIKGSLHIYFKDR